MAVWGIRLGELDTALILGVESMSRVPHFSRRLRNGVRVGAVELTDPLYPISYPGHKPVSVDASNGADKYRVPRRMLDSFAMGSHLKWEGARRAGKFEDEIEPIRVRKHRRDFLFSQDEMPRPKGTVAGIGMLPAVFGSNTTTAGNAPGLNDGASAMVVMRAEKAAALKLPQLGTVVDMAAATDTPEGISWIPALAIQRLLAKTGTAVDDLDLIEINE